MKSFIEIIKFKEVKINWNFLKEQEKYDFFLIFNTRGSIK